MLKAKSKASDGDGDASGLVLRVRAEGAQGIAAAGGLLGTADRKPDPYVTFRLGGASRTCAHVNDVEPLLFFSWPAAEAEFPVADELELVKGPLEVVVRDKDVLKDRFIGGVDVSLADLMKENKGDRSVGGDRVLCQSRMFPLQFADERRKAKSKPGGEVKLTITLVDTRAEKVDQKEAVSSNDTSAHGSEQTRKPSTVVETWTSKPPGQQDAVVSGPARPDAVEAAVATGTTSPTKPTPSSDRILNPSHDATAPSASPNIKSDDKEQAAVPANPPVTTLAPPTVDSTATTASKDVRMPPTPAASDANQNPSHSIRVAKRLTIELVSASNLIRPSGLGALFDRKPDPFVVLEFAGVSQSSTPLKDVDIKQPVLWSAVDLSFELPPDPTAILRPKGAALLDLLIHIKDENLTKPTYMGGAKASLDEFFDPSTAAQAWTMTATAVEGVERVYPLTFADERMKKRKACGELTVRFHFELLDLPVDLEGEEEEKSSTRTGKQLVQEKQDRDPTALDTMSDHPPVATTTDAVQGQSEPVKTVPKPPAQHLTSDIQSLSVQVLCGRQLRKSIAVSNPLKGMMKAVFDRKPDPYVVLLLQGHAPHKTPAVQDADVSFVEWKDAAQVYQFSRKPYPTELVLQVRDRDAVGSDPFMGGARLDLQSVWAQVEADNSSEQTELVSTIPLAFADEQMTKHQPRGELTLRFRWVYATEPLPVSVDEPNEATGSPQEEQQVETSLEKQQDTSLLRYLSIDYLRLWNNPAVISTSHDLYVELSCVSQRLPPETLPTQRVVAASRVLTDATKRLKPDEVVEWGDEALLVPIVVPDRLGTYVEGVDDYADVLIELKDKNAIANDTSVARKKLPTVQLLSSFDLKGGTSSTVKMELEPSTTSGRGKKSALAVTIEARLTLLPLDSPVIIPPQSEAATMTVFVISGSIDWSPPPIDGEDVKFGLFTVLQPPKSSSGMFGGLLSSFVKPHIADQVDFYPLSKDRRRVDWRTGFDTLVPSKQIQSAREKEALTLDIQLWSSSTDKKSKPTAPRMVGSYQVDVWPFLSTTSGPTTAGNNPVQDIQIPLGHLNGVMTLSFGIAFRRVQPDSSSEKKAGAASLLAQDPPPGNGNLHLLVLYAQKLVPPDSSETAVQLDPEVRVAIEPKYVKRKENPVRSMLKTRPIENAGDTPAWNEYLRLEYRLPVSQLTTTDPVTTGIAPPDEEKAQEKTDPAKLPAPIVVIGVYDIQIPGERSSSSVIGRAELPLSAFALPHCSPSVLQPLPVYMTVDVHLEGKKTGRLTLEGVFEPLAPLSAKTSTTTTDTEGDDASYRSLCRSVGRSLRDKAKTVRAGGATATLGLTMDTTAAPARSLSGRVDVHVEGARGAMFDGDDGVITAHVWLMSSLDDRKELKSRSRSSAGSTTIGSDAVNATEAKWDVQVSLYTADIATDILRVELLSSKGASLGSLKQPVSGLQSCQRGEMIRDKYPILTMELPKARRRATTSTDAPNSLTMGLAFHQDQQLWDPIDAKDSTTDSTGSSTSIFIQCGRFLFSNDSTTDPVKDASQPPASGLDGAVLTVRASLLAGVGATDLAPVATSSQPLVISRTTRVVDWGDEVLRIETDSSAAALVARSYAIGTCPVLRTEVIAKRKTSRFHDVIVSYDISLTALLRGWQGKRLSTWAPLYSSTTLVQAKAPPLVGVLRLGVAVSEHHVSTSTNPFQLSTETSNSVQSELSPLPGVLCLRFIAGRNLTDVDANGEQDPYVIARIRPSSRPVRGLKTRECVTSVSLNGGRHPQWNSTVYDLSCSDLWTDYLRLEVVDSNEEDQLPDATIGTLNVALASLFRDEICSVESESTPFRGKTAWMETWLPVYRIGTDGLGDGDVETAGDVRAEYRFVSFEYFRQSQSEQQDAAAVSPYSPTFDCGSTLTDASVSGSVFLHIVGASNLPFNRGMQPAIRISCPAIGFVHVTSIGKQSICDPVWSNEVVEIPIKTSVWSSRPSTLTVEIVDVAVRTANVNALAVVTFGSVNIAAFLRHPTASSFGFYPLGNSLQAGIVNAIESAGPSLFLGCQFIPEDKREACQPFTTNTSKPEEVKNWSRGGQVHVKALQLRFDLPSYLNEMVMSRSPMLRLKLVYCCITKSIGSHTESKSMLAALQQTLRVPTACTSISHVVESEGTVDWTELDPVNPGNVALFEWTSPGCTGHEADDGSMSTLVQRANPILVCELILSGSQDESAAVVVGEVELPIFDFVLLDGHMATGWYPLSTPSDLTVVANSTSATNYQTTKCGEVKLEVQFLPRLTPTELPRQGVDTTQTTDSSAMLLTVIIQQVRVFPAARHGVYVVCVDLMGSRAETKPSMTSTRDSLTWDEVLELAMPRDAASNSVGSLTVSLRNLAGDSKAAVASCNWVVPPSMLSSSADGDDGDEGVVVLQLLDPEWKQSSSGKRVVAEIAMLVQRSQAHGPHGSPSTKAIGKAKALSTRRGVLYVCLLPGGDTRDDEQVGWSASIAVRPASTTRESVLSSLPSESQASDRVRLQFEQFAAVSVPETPPPAELKCVVVVQSATATGADSVAGYAELSSSLLSSVVSQPRVEVFQQLRVQSTSLSAQPEETKANPRPSTSSSTASAALSVPKTLDTRLLFVNVVLGHFLVAFRSVTSTTSALQAFNRFRVELRLLHSRSVWEKSTVAAWNKERSRVEWSGSQAEGVKLAFSNEVEMAEPRLQFVLFGLVSKRQLPMSSSIEDDVGGGDRVAYGQVSLLSVLTEPDWNSGSVHSRQIQLAAIGGASDSAGGSLGLDLGIGFVGMECTNDELEAQRARERRKQALQLAEGTATLKKTFVVLGGDEERPISVLDLKKFILNEAADGMDGLEAAREVLKKAADQETEGDLDRLFAIMDVNGDGQISWDEYVQHMQTLHALADAASAHSMAREQQTEIDDMAESGTVVDDVDDVDPDSEMGDLDGDSEEEIGEREHVASSFISSVAQPLSGRTQTGSVVDRYEDPTPAPQPAIQADELERAAVKPLPREASFTDDAKTAVKKSQASASTTRSVRTKEIDEERDASDERDSRRYNPTAKREPAVTKRVAPVPSRKPLSTTVLDWKVDDVVQWLEEEMELGQYADAIVRNAVNGRLLLTLSESELETELGVTAPLHKRKLLTHIAELQEVAGYPPLQLETKRPRVVGAIRLPQTTETPAFIRREQLLYQVKQATAEPEETPFNATKPVRKRPTQTTLVMEQPLELTAASTRTSIRASTKVKTRTRPASPVQAVGEGESFFDAMQDVLEAVGESSSYCSDAGSPGADSPQLVDDAFEPPKLPLIQVGSATSTDELFEITKQRIHQLAGQMLPLVSQQPGDSFSDFGGEDEDDDSGDMTTPKAGHQQASGLRLVFHAMANSQSKDAKLSRLRFQASLLSLLAIDASWHQFDLLFRRLDADNNAELGFDEFQRVFRSESISFEAGDLRALQDALVDVVLDRLETQQWTLLELFRAFDRDGGGSISIAEFGTLVRFLLAKSGAKRDQRSARPRRALSNRQVYLLLSCMDVSSDHRVGQHEFLRFFFVVWSARLMEAQDRLFRLEQTHRDAQGGTVTDAAVVAELDAVRRKLRRALRTNFSRPFRDAMRCLDARMPSPFAGLLAKLQLLPVGAQETRAADGEVVQVWQVLKGQQAAESTLLASQAREQPGETRRRERKRGNELLRTRLTRRREPAREGAELRTPAARVALDEDAALKVDRHRA